MAGRVLTTLLCSGTVCMCPSVWYLAVPMEDAGLVRDCVNDDLATISCAVEGATYPSE